MKRPAGTDLRLRILALVGLPLVALGTRTLGVTRCWRVLATREGPIGSATRTGESALVRAQAIVGAVDRVNRLYGSLLIDCLPRSLVAWWLLRLERIPAELCIGVRTLTGDLDAHAWVEVDGQAVGEGDDVRGAYEAFRFTEGPPPRSHT